MRYACTSADVISNGVISDKRKAIKEDLFEKYNDT